MIEPQQKVSFLSRTKVNPARRPFTTKKLTQSCEHWYILVKGHSLRNAELHYFSRYLRKILQGSSVKREIIANAAKYVVAPPLRCLVLHKQLIYNDYVTIYIFISASCPSAKRCG